jgi:hypothetical protein
MTGHALHGDEATDGAAAVWPGELDEQLISELLSNDVLLQVPAGESEHYRSRDAGPDAASPAPCNSSAAGREVPQPAEVSRALCSVYSGPTIQDVEKALSSSSRPCYGSSMYL